MPMHFRSMMKMRMISDIPKLSGKTVVQVSTLFQTRCISTTPRLLNSKKDQSSSEPNQHTANSGRPSVSDSDKQPRQEGKAKTVAQADQELRERLEKMSGGGGASGIEYEDGQPNTMKRGVRNNMFRLI